MVHPPEDGRSTIQVLTGPVVHATNSANHYATPPTKSHTVKRNDQDVNSDYIQGGDADVSCTAWFRTTLLGVVIHMCRRHAAPTQAQVRLH